MNAKSTRVPAESQALATFQDNSGDNKGFQYVQQELADNYPVMLFEETSFDVATGSPCRNERK